MLDTECLGTGCIPSDLVDVGQLDDLQGASNSLVYSKADDCRTYEKIARDLWITKTNWSFDALHLERKSGKRSGKIISEKIIFKKYIKENQSLTSQNLRKKHVWWTE